MLIELNNNNMALSIKKTPAGSPKKGKKPSVLTSAPGKIVFTVIPKEEVERTRCSVYPYSL